jgi:hypothetical protein
MTTAMRTVHEERAEFGAIVLDAKRPGWWRDVDLAMLATGSHLWTVGAQLYGTATEACVKLGADLLAPTFFSWSTWTTCPSAPIPRRAGPSPRRGRN